MIFYLLISIRKEDLFSEALDSTAKTHVSYIMQSNADIHMHKTKMFTRENI